MIQRFLKNGNGAIYDAPIDSLPVLALMQERQATQEARYYTENINIAIAHRTLSDSGFTGYIELSEDISSGDYYVIYHDGNAKVFGFVGEASRLIADDEVFQKASDEVGIYSVRTVEISPFELIDPPLSQANKNSGTKVYKPENSRTGTRILETDDINDTTATTFSPDVNDDAPDVNDDAPDSEPEDDCGNDNPELSFCPSCGLSLSHFPKAKYCPDCGVNLSYYRP